MLPVELLFLIFSYLSWEDRITCERVCKLWRDVNDKIIHRQLDRDTIVKISRRRTRFSVEKRTCIVKKLIPEVGDRKMWDRKTLVIFLIEQNPFRQRIDAVINILRKIQPFCLKIDFYNYYLFDRIVETCKNIQRLEVEKYIPIYDDIFRISGMKSLSLPDLLIDTPLPINLNMITFSDDVFVNPNDILNVLRTCPRLKILKLCNILAPTHAFISVLEYFSNIFVLPSDSPTLIISYNTSFKCNDILDCIFHECFPQPLRCVCFRNNVRILFLGSCPRI